MMLSTRLHRIPLPRRHQAQAAWAAARRDPALMLWRITTAPLWLGSDVPIPDAPSRHAVQWGDLETVDAGPGRHVRVAMGNLLRRYRVSWFLTSILRGVSLGLWLALIWMLIALATDVGSPNRWWVGGLMLLGLVLGAAFGVLNRPTPLRLARSLDQTFRLNERLTTALDPALKNTRSPAMQLQYADTANGLAEIRPELGIGSFIPFREVFVALIAGLLLLAAFFADVPGGDLPAASSGVVPPFASAADRLAVQETPPPSNAQSPLPSDPPAQDAAVLEQAETSNQTRQDLEALGDAFSDYSLTKPASDSIAQGDYDQAADDLNDAAESVDSLSPEARESLADDLEQAASQMSPANPDLAQSAQDTADSLREDDGDAGEKLNDLAGEIDKAGDKVAPNAEIAAGPDTSTSAPQSNAGSDESQDASGQPQANSPQGAPVEGAGDPGSGASAQPGLANEEIDPNNQQSSQSGSEPGGQQSGGGQAPSESQPTDGGESPSDASGGEGVPSENQDGSGSSPGEQNQQDDSSSSDGGGAGGESDVESPGGEPQQGGSGAEGSTEERPEADTAQQGKAGDPPPGGDESEDGASAPPPSSRDSLVLEGTSDENIPSGSDVGSSSLGSGSGASAASGNAAPAAVGEAGPDSNRVPEDYRDYVEDYFNRDRP